MRKKESRMHSLITIIILLFCITLAYAAGVKSELLPDGSRMIPGDFVTNNEDHCVECVSPNSSNPPACYNLIPSNGNIK